MRIHRARYGRHFACGDTGGCQQQGLGLFQASFAQYFGLHGIAVHHGHPFAAQKPHRVDIHFHNHRQHAAVLQNAAATAPYGAVAHHNHPRAVAFVRHDQAGRWFGSVAALALLPPQGHILGLAVQHGVERDGNDGRRNKRIVDPLVKNPKADAEARKNKSKFTHLRQGGGHGQSQLERLAEQACHQQRPKRLHNHDDKEGRQHEGPVLRQRGRVKEHAHRHKEQHGKGITQGQGFGGGTGAELGLPHNHASQECAKRHGRPKKLRSSNGNAKGQSQHRKGKQIAGARAGHVAQKQRNKLLPNHKRKHGERRQFEQGHAQGAPEFAARRKNRRQQHKQQNGKDVFHHQPAQSHMPGGIVQVMVICKHSGKHHGAGYRNSHAVDRAREQIKAEKMQQPHACQRCQRDLRRCATSGNGPHGQQILEMKMQAHAKHQQDNANLGALGRRGRIGHKAGGVRSYDDACQQIAHKGRKAQFLRDKTKNQGGGKPPGKRKNKIYVMGHGWCSFKAMKRQAASS